jgi:hypothetical protein
MQAVGDQAVGDQEVADQEVAGQGIAPAQLFTNHKVCQLPGSGDMRLSRAHVKQKDSDEAFYL